MHPTFFCPVTPPFTFISPHMFPPNPLLILTYLYCCGSDDRTAVYVLLGSGRGGVNYPGPHVHPCSRNPGLRRRPTIHCGCIRFLCVRNYDVSTCMSRNPELLYRSSDLEYRY